MRAQPGFAGNPGALRLDGELLELESVRLDGRAARAPRLHSDRQGTRHRRAARAGAFTLEIVTYCNPEANKALTGPLPVARHLLHAVRGPGLPPHHLFPRPPRRARHLHGAHRGRPRRGAGAALQRQSGWSAARSTGASATTRCGATRTPSPATCSRWWAAIWPPTPPTSPPRRGARWTCASTSSPARRTAAPGRWIRSSASMRWDEERFGREYDLDVFNIVAVSDFNMGAMENKGLNIFNDAPGPGLARDRHRQQLRRHRARHRARVLPQLDRQPHHLPRLVPALPQGRA